MNRFNYSEEYSSRWPSYVEKAASQGVTVSTSVFWGAHEATPGMRDFNRAPRLRVEKFLRLLKEHKVPAKLVVGFPAGEECFPKWAIGNTPRENVIVGSAWNPLELFSGLSIPLLQDVVFWRKHLEFLDELFSLLALYLNPEGPIESVEFDFGPYLTSPSVIPFGEESIGIARYESLKQFNDFYQTSFGSVDAGFSEAGFRALCRKRDWLAAFDFKWLRNEIFNKKWKSISELKGARNLGAKLSLRRSVPLAIGNTDNDLFVFDSVPVEFGAGELLPLFPFYQVHANYLAYYRSFLNSLCEKGLWRGRRSAIPISDLAEVKENTQIYVLCGKYLSISDFQKLKRLLKAGHQMHFPLALPQFDENLQPLPWSLGSMTEEHISNRTYRRYAVDSGAVFQLSGERA